MLAMKIKTAKVLGKTMRGSVHRQFKKCGKKNCKCARGELHSTFYHFVRIDGKLKTRYLKKSEADQIQMACRERRMLGKEQKEKLNNSMNNLRQIATGLRDSQRIIKQSLEV